MASSSSSTTSPAQQQIPYGQVVQMPSASVLPGAPNGYQYVLMPNTTGTSIPVVQYGPPSHSNQNAFAGASPLFQAPPRRQNRRRGRGGRAGAGAAYAGASIQVARTGMVGVMPTTQGSIAPAQFRKPSTPGGLRLRGKELLTKYVNPNSTGEFACIYVGINPNNFQWLKAYAPNYEQFFFHWIRISWQPAFASANGTVGIGVDTDFSDAVPKNLVEVLKNHSSVAGLVCAPMSCEYHGYMSLCQRHLISSGGGQSSTSINQGMILMFSEAIGEQTAYGVKAQTPLGYVYVEYDVELFVPQG